MNIALNDCFPADYTPNHPQEIILDGIAEALAMKKKFIIINAPTGSGKSFISKTLANYSKKCEKYFEEGLQDTCRWQNLSYGRDESFGAAVLTCTKSLQDQYAAQFSDGDVLKGKINYECALGGGEACDMGECIYDDKLKDKCWKRRQCPYYKARYDTVVNKCSFYNYSMYLSLPDCVKYKQFLICDEASELEDVLVTEYTTDICLSDVNTYLSNMMPIPPDEGASKHAYYKWLVATNNSFMLRIKELTTSADGQKRKMNKDEVKAYKALTALQTSVTKLIACWDDSDWFKLHKVDEYDKAHIVFVPYEVDKLAANFFDFGETVILMSATIVNPKNYAKTLGITDYYFIDAPSMMDAGRAFISPVNPDFRPNYKNMDVVMPKMAKVAKEICKQFSTKKGIIHTHSNAILKIIQKELGKGKRFLYRDNANNNEMLMEAHKATTTPTVLVSPSMTHGVDLKGHLGEFQIVMKAPYPSLGDPRISRKFKEDKEWYQDKMLSTLIQACGRCNRSNEDISITFIMDFNAYEALVKNSRKLPAYFNARLTEEAKNTYKELVSER